MKKARVGWPPPPPATELDFLAVTLILSIAIAALVEEILHGHQCHPQPIHVAQFLGLQDKNTCLCRCSIAYELVLGNER